MTDVSYGSIDGFYSTKLNINIVGFNKDNTL